jgi:HSP20 family protein
MPPERDLFANFDRMRREIDELFGDVFDRSGFGPGRAFTPEVDVYYCGNPPRAVVRAELAGVDVDEVALEIRGRQLIIAGERRAQEASNRLYQQIEIANGPFRRVVELGADVEADNASATYEDGILRIEIPLVQQTDETRRIPIEPKAGELGEGG